MQDTAHKIQSLFSLTLGQEALEQGNMMEKRKFKVISLLFAKFSHSYKGKYLKCKHS